jgi:type IV fimbrial biogenesis protein FimT
MSAPVRHGLHRARGFSLVELIITISVVGILATIATPSMSSIMTHHRVRDASSDLFAALLKARGQAIMINSDVRVVPVGGDWAAGWQVPDPSNPGSYFDKHEPVDAVTITMSGASSLTYQFNGRIRSGLGVKFNLSASNGGRGASACITVDPSGRPYSEDKPCAG